MLAAIRRTAPTLGLLSSMLALATGCGLINQPSRVTAKLFASHSGTPTDAGYPDLGDENTTRVFFNDLGWQLSIAELYVTTAGVTLVRCGEDEGTAIEMFWGSCPEDFIGSNDRQTLGLGAATLSEGRFCRLDVNFGPFIYDPEVDDHIVPDNPEVEGTTIFLRGIARRGEGDAREEVRFELTSDAELSVQIDISELEDGDPLHLADDPFGRNLTVVKFYDRFFDGIDFADYQPAELEAAILAGLEFDTVVYNGTPN